MANENYLSELVTRLLEQETSEEMAEIKRMIYRRIATESDIKLSRIPAPLNITEIGGYFYLLLEINQKEMLRQTLPSILGLPKQPPTE